MKKLLNIVIITAMIISSCNMFSISVGAEEFVNENVLINGGFEDDEGIQSYISDDKLAGLSENGATGWHAYDSSNAGVKIIPEPGNESNHIISYDKLQGNWYGGIKQALPQNRLATGKYTIKLRAKNAGPSKKASLYIQLVTLKRDNKTGIIERHSTAPYRKISYGYDGEKETLSVAEVYDEWTDIEIDADVAPWLSNTEYIDLLNDDADKTIVAFSLEIRPNFGAGTTSRPTGDYEPTLIYIDDVSVNMPEPLIASVDDNYLNEVQYNNANIPVNFNYNDGIYENSLKNICVEDEYGRSVECEAEVNDKSKVNVKIKSLQPNSTYTLIVDNVISSTPVPDPTKRPTENAKEHRYVSMMDAQKFEFKTINKIIIDHKDYDSNQKKARITFVNNDLNSESFLIAIFNKNNGAISSPVYYKTVELAESGNTDVEFNDVELTSGDFEVKLLKNFGGTVDTDLADNSKLDIVFSAVNETISYNGQLNDSFAGKKVTVEVIVPNESGALNNFPADSEGTAENIFLDISELTVNADGTFTSEPISISKSGTYRLIAKVDDKVFADENKYYSSKADNDKFIELIDGAKPNERADVLLKALEKEHIEQKIRYDETYYNMLGESAKKLLCVNMAKKMPFENIDTFKTVFAEETLRMVLFNETVPENIQGILDKKYKNESSKAIEDLLDLKELSKLSVFGDYSKLNNEEQLDFCNYFAGILKGSDTVISAVEQYKSVFSAAMLNNLIGKTLLHKDVSQILSSHTDILDGLKFNLYENLGTEQSYVNEDIKNHPQFTLDKFIEYANLSIEKYYMDSDDNSGGNDRNTGGKLHANVSASPVKLEQKNNNYFNDIKEVDWAKDAIETLYERKIISGRGNSIFDPNGFVSREEFIKMVVVAAGITPGGNNNGGFSDVSVDSWYYPYICAAFQNGITKGIGENQFGIGKNIIRQDVFVMCDYLLNNTKTPDKEGIEKFVDSELVSDYAKDTIDKFTKLGIISGNDRGELNPKSDMTRAEAAKILYNILVLTNKI